MLKIIYALYHVYYHFERGMKIIMDYSKLVSWFWYSGSANSGPNACNRSHPAPVVKDVFKNRKRLEDFSRGFQGYFYQLYGNI